MLMSACQLVAKSHMADYLILQKENVFCMTFGLAVDWPTCTFNSIKVPSSNIYLIYMYIYIYVSFYVQLFCHLTELQSLLK